MAFNQNAQTIARQRPLAISCCVLLVAILWTIPVGRKASAQTSDALPKFRGALLTTTMATTDRIGELRKQGYNRVVLRLDGKVASDPDGLATVVRRIQNAELELFYWIEIARCPALANEHPEWMASLQTHDEWRRFFPQVPEVKPDEVAKTYPWVPILSREPFTGQLSRVKQLLATVAEPQGVFLNDLQGAPSACGCGNPLCRWTSDYGKRRTTVPLGDDAAALFVNAVKRIIPGAEVIPVWTTECEEHDGAADGLCAGVGCFEGICWKAYAKQLSPVQATVKRLGVLTPYKAFQRDIPRYGTTASWIGHAVESFRTMPAKHGEESIPAARLVTVLQGWDVTAAEIAAQIAVARAAGVNGYVVAFAEIQQGWEPKIIKWK